MRPGFWKVLTLGLVSGLLVDLLLRLEGLAWPGWLAPLALVPLLWALRHAPSAWAGALAMLLFALPADLWVHEGGFVLFPDWTFLGFAAYALGYALLGAWAAVARRRWGLGAGALALVAGWAALMFVLMSQSVTGAYAHVAWAALPVIVMDTPLLGTAAWSGFVGLGVLLWLLSLGCYMLLLERRWVPLAVTAGISALAVLLAPTPKPTGHSSDFTIVQQNAPYLEETLSAFHAPLAEGLLQPLARLSQSPQGVLLWPEGSVPFPINPQRPDPTLLRALSESPEALVGGLTADAKGQLFNTALRWKDGRLESAYVKQVLMPGGEDHFTAGDSSQPVGLGGLRAGVLICYESIIPWVALRSVRSGAEVLVVITSNSFAGASDTPQAHLAGSRILAAALGRPLVYASKTGPSVFQDVRGNVLAHTERGAVTTLRGRAHGYAGLTPYARFGDWLGLLGLLVVVGQMMLMVSRPFALVTRPEVPVSSA